MNFMDAHGNVIGAQLGSNALPLRPRAFLEKVKKKYRNSQRNRVPWDYEKKIS